MSEVIERTTSTGATLRVEYELSTPTTARILSWRRKPKGGEHWQHVKHQVGQAYPLRQLLGPTPGAIDAVLAERERQDAAHGAPGERGITLHEWLAILVEEVGEVAKDVHEGRDPTGELVQVAAVAIAVIEAQ